MAVDLHGIVLHEQFSSFLEQVISEVMYQVIHISRLFPYRTASGSVGRSSLIIGWNERGDV